MRVFWLPKEPFWHPRGQLIEFRSLGGHFCMSFSSKEGTLDLDLGFKELSLVFCQAESHFRMCFGAQVSTLVYVLDDWPAFSNRA